MSFITKLIYARTTPVVGRFIHEMLGIYGIDIPNNVKIGPGLVVHHRGNGIVITPKAVIGANVHIFHQVTLGTRTSPEGKSLPDVAITIGDGCILYPGSKVVGGWRPTHVGAGTEIAPNSVLTKSTGDNEVWSGVPAILVKGRQSKAPRS